MTLSEALFGAKTKITAANADGPQRQRSNVEAANRQVVMVSNGSGDGVAPIVSVHTDPFAGGGVGVPGPGNPYGAANYAGNVNLSQPPVGKYGQFDPNGNPLVAGQRQQPGVGGYGTFSGDAVTPEITYFQDPSLVTPNGDPHVAVQTIASGNGFNRGGVSYLNTVQPRDTPLYQAGNGPTDQPAGTTPDRVFVNSPHRVNFRNGFSVAGVDGNANAVWADPSSY